MSTSDKPRLLKLVPYEEQILRQPAETVQFPLSEEDKNIIRDMRYSIQGDQLKEAGAPWASASGMAANQWGINKRIFLFCPEGNAANQLEVIINPSYEPIVDPNSGIPQKDEIWEGCFSIPLATGNISRFKKIRVTYQNESGDIIHKELNALYARVFQHETDHLNGFLYDDPRSDKCLEKVTFNSNQELEDFYMKVREERQRKYEEDLRKLRGE